MIDEIERQIKPKIKGKLIYLSQYGSHLYGLDTPESDLDFRGVYIPMVDDFILHKDKDEINEELEIEIPQPSPTQKVGNMEVTLSVLVTKKVKVDVKIFSLQKFIELCRDADTNALDLLFSLKTDAGHQWKYEGLVKNIEEEMKYPIRYIYKYRHRLINTDRLFSPITYAHKQATKYSIKGIYVSILDKLIETATDLYDNGQAAYVEDLLPYIEIDGQNVRIDEMDNHGSTEHYLYVCGVQHQFNLGLSVFIERLQNKLKTYSERSLKACRDKGNDWKALSHAIRVLLEVQELLETGNISLPLKDVKFVKDIKLGNLSREEVDKYFTKNLAEVLEQVEQDKLGWKYDEEFWNEFILKETKGCKA